MVMGILLSNPLLADTIPAEAIYMVGAGVFLFAVALAFSISFVFNKLLQYTRKEERAHIWFMAIGALVFPLIYMLLEEKFHFVGRLEFVFGYNGFALANILIIVALIFVGFHAGYFATVLKKEPEQRNSEQKRRGIKLQSIAWLIAITIFVLMAMKDQLREMKQANDLKKMTEKRTTAAIRHIIDLLNKEFDKVKWNEGSQTFSARTKEGLEV